VAGPHMVCVLSGVVGELRQSHTMNRELTTIAVMGLAVVPTFTRHHADNPLAGDVGADTVEVVHDNGDLAASTILGVQQQNSLSGGSRPSEEIQHLGVLTADGVEPLRQHEMVLRVLEDIGSEDRKSTRLNSSHVKISYAVFC